jgi:hypothetical protein
MVPTLDGFALLEAVEHAVRTRIGHIDRIHARAGRSLARPADQGLDRTGLAGRERLTLPSRRLRTQPRTPSRCAACTIDQR